MREDRFYFNSPDPLFQIGAYLDHLSRCLWHDPESSVMIFATTAPEPSLVTSVIIGF